ncbi:MAG: hypothetical protein ABEK16_00985 [Candidatus Nanohalobium sp.]
MKNRILLTNLAVLTSSAIAHSAHSEDYHAQEQALFQQVNPVLAVSIVMLAVGLIALALSYRKYWEES